MTELDIVFRSIINFKNASGVSTIAQAELVKNFRAMQEVIPEAPEEKAYKALYYFIRDYVKDCTGAPEVPSYEFIKNHYENVEGNETVLAILEQIKSQQPYIGQDFRRTLKMYNEDQSIASLERVLSNASKIASTGMEVGRGKKKRRLRGVMDAISYMALETKPLQQSITGVKLESQVVSREDADEFLEEYDKINRDPMEAIGIFTGISHIDNHLKGLKNTELMLCAAWTGHCKTTFCLNMAYQAVFSGWNTAFVTLEMSHDEIRKALYTLHSCNRHRFKQVAPEYAHLAGTIKYNDVQYGTLNKEERKFLEVVAKDFSETEGYGKCTVWQPDKSVTTVSDVDFKLRQIQQEYQSDGVDLDFVILDYISLMGNEEGDKSRDYNQNLNNIIKSLKRLCLTFNNGKGLRVLSPFQVNREGYKDARANDGIYLATALSNAHEAERSSDVIITLFISDDDRGNGMIKICNPKARRDRPFTPFHACVNFESKYMFDYAGDFETDPIKNMEIVISQT